MTRGRGAPLEGVVGSSVHRIVSCSCTRQRSSRSSNAALCCDLESAPTHPHQFLAKFDSKRVGQVLLCALHHWRPCGVKRGPQPKLLEKLLLQWIDKMSNQCQCPTRDEINDEAIAMSVNNENLNMASAACAVGKKFKKRNSRFPELKGLAQKVAE